LRGKTGVFVACSVAPVAPGGRSLSCADKKVTKETAPHSAVRFADSLRFSNGAGTRELAILKKSEDRSNIPRSVFAPSCDARRLQGEAKKPCLLEETVESV